MTQPSMAFQHKAAMPGHSRLRRQCTGHQNAHRGTAVLPDGFDKTADSADSTLCPHCSRGAVATEG